MRVVTTIALLLSLAWDSHAATVTVLRPDGRPLANAAVLCRGHENDPALTGDDGRAAVPNDCSFTTCMAGGYLSSRAKVVSGTAVCRLIDGVRVTLRLVDSKCGDRCWAVLEPAALDGDRVSREFEDDSEDPQPVADLGVVRPGGYTIEVFGGDGSWICRRPCDFLRTGEESIQATWRPPLELPGIVLGENGAPVADIPVRMRAARAGPDRPADAWRCLRDDQAPDVFTAEGGSFVLPIDPTVGGVIEAGSFWDPDGFASVELVPPILASITLRVKRAR
jgi:hypothetical protein